MSPWANSQKGQVESCEHVRARSVGAPRPMWGAPTRSAQLARAILSAAQRTGMALLMLCIPACHDWESLSSTYGEPARVSCAAFVVAGSAHSCARLADGRLFCWGDNRFGQLGTGDDRGRPEPTQIDLGGKSAVKVGLPVAFGDVTADLGVFSCVITADNALSCWGDNRFGQLGVGDLQTRAQPAVVEALGGNVARIAGGAGHACAQLTGGEVSCWGRGVNGQLGDGSNGQTPLPVAVAPAMLVADRIACGGDHSCAKTPDGALWCWGANTHGQLGDGTTDASNVPVLVGGFGQAVVSSVSAGGRHSCVYASDGAMWCWGSNQYGQLGTTDFDNRLVPARVDLPGQVAHVYAGGSHTCALLVDGSLWCWGSNQYGQLGSDGDVTNPVPVRVAAELFGNDVTAAWAGGAHTCALGRDGSVWCWGNNQFGQLGVAGASSAEPLQVIAPCG